MKTVPLGSQKKQVSIVGLGGEGVLRTYDKQNEAQQVINEALQQNISYCDCARVYSDSELYYGSVWKNSPEQRETIFQTSKSASRDRDGALADLSASLQRLQTEYLDLWQIHDVRTEEDLAAISGTGGALEAFVTAREKGLVKNIGVTGHHDPHILTKAVEQWPVDTVLMPVNPAEQVLGGFLTHTLETARNKDVAVIGMKVLGAGHYVTPKLGLTAEVLIRYALSCGITLAIVGCSTAEEVRELATAATLPPLTEAEKEQITDLFTPHARQNAFYRGVI
ncbi:MAG TPA: aldo/keto reductase [Desulfocapsa sulfexigens]|nr:aldo/keto reductase [Desulfocapsa sulfexigens]